MRYISIYVAVFLCGLIGAAQAETDVSGRYQIGDGGNVRVLLTIQAPPPAAFIVLQTVPQGAKVVAASPAPSGFQQDANTVKWFFKRPAPGTTMLSMQFSRPVPTHLLTGEIRYRHPANGSFVIHKIRH